MKPVVALEGRANAGPRVRATGVLCRGRNTPNGDMRSGRHRGGSWCGAWALCLLLCLCARELHADGDVDITRLRPAIDEEGFVTLSGTRTPGSWLWNLGLFAHYSWQPLSLETAAGTIDVVRHRSAFDLAGQIGLGGRAALSLQTQVVAWQTGEPLAPSDAELPGFAIADPRLALKYRLVGDDADREQEHKDGPGLAVRASGDIPVGADSAYVSEGALRSHLELLGDFQVLGAGAGASLGWRHRFHTRERLGETFRDELTFAAAFKLPLPWYPKLVTVLEVHGATDAGAPFDDSTTTPVEGELGARLRLTRDLVMALAVGTGFTDGVGSPALRALGGVWWAPRVHDKDNDGIDDSDDACPPLPEDLDGFQDDDGCPDPDNDNDFIPDVDDLCPNEAALEGQDVNEDGCTD